MILVDVQFPELNRTIDFLLDETVQGWDIVDEIAAMLAQSDLRPFTAAQIDAMLYSVERKCALDLNRSLRGNSVQSGDRLLFI